MLSKRRMFGVLCALFAVPLVAIWLGGCGGSGNWTPQPPVQPTLTLNNAVDNTLTVTDNGPTTLKGTATGNVNRILVKVDDQAARPATLSLSPSDAAAVKTYIWEFVVTLSHGKHTVVVTSLDASSNPLLAPATYTVTNNGTPPNPPTVAITDPAANKTVSTNTYLLKGTATKDPAGPAITKVEISINGAAAIVADGTDTWSKTVTLRSGANVITATAFAGDTPSAPATRTITYTAPVPPPTVAITDPAADKTVTAAAYTIKGTAAKSATGSAVSKVEVTVNGGTAIVATGTTSWSAPVTLAAGANTIVAKAFADGQESAPATRTITYNAPVTYALAITSPAASSSQAGNINVVASLSPLTSVASVVFKANGTAFDTQNPAASVTGVLDTLGIGLANGAVSLTVEARDASGNVLKTSAPVSITVNNGRSLYVTDVPGNKGDKVTISINLNQFSDVSAVTATLLFDPTQLQVDNAGARPGSGAPNDDAAAVGRQFLKNNPSAGVEKLVLVMPIADTGAEALTGSQVMTVPFTILGDTGTRASITFDTSSSSLTNLTDLNNKSITSFAAVGGRIITK